MKKQEADERTQQRPETSPLHRAMRALVQRKERVINADDPQMVAYLTLVEKARRDRALA